MAKFMKGQKLNGIRAIILVLGGSGGAIAFAETEQQKGVFRVGIDYSVATLDVKGLEESYSSDDLSFAVGVKFGYELPNRFGVEVGNREYINLNFISPLIPGTDVALDHSVFYVLPTYTWGDNNLYFRAKLGLGRWASDYAVNIDPERNSNDRENRTETGIDPYLGIEGGFQFTHVEFGLFYDYQSADFVEVKGGGILASYRF